MKIRLWIPPAPVQWWEVGLLILGGVFLTVGLVLLIAMVGLLIMKQVNKYHKKEATGYFITAGILLGISASLLTVNGVSAVEKEAMNRENLTEVIQETEGIVLSDSQTGELFSSGSVEVNEKEKILLTPEPNSEEYDIIIEEVKK